MSLPAYATRTERSCILTPNFSAYLNYLDLNPHLIKDRVTPTMSTRALAWQVIWWRPEYELAWLVHWGQWILSSKDFVPSYIIYIYLPCHAESMSLALQPLAGKLDLTCMPVKRLSYCWAWHWNNVPCHGLVVNDKDFVSKNDTVQFWPAWGASLQERAITQAGNQIESSPVPAICRQIYSRERLVLSWCPLLISSASVITVERLCIIFQEAICPAELTRMSHKYQHLLCYKKKETEKYLYRY